MRYLHKWWKDKSPSDATKTLAEQAKDAFIQKVRKFHCFFDLLIDWIVTLQFNLKYAETPTESRPLLIPSRESVWGEMFNEQDTAPIGSEAERYLNEPVTNHPDGRGPSSLVYWKVSYIVH